MKTIIKNDKIIVFLNGQFIQTDNLDKYFRKLLLSLNKKYEIPLKGYYNINVYEDKNYGMVLELIYEDMEYYNYFDQIDLNINIMADNEFLYKIKYEFLDNITNNGIVCYKYNNELYLQLKNQKNLFHILELIEVVYDKTSEIKKYGEKVIV